MRKTLESMFNTAKSYVKKTAGVLVAASVLAVAPQPEVKGDVYLTLEPQNGIGFLAHYVSKDTIAFDLHIYADNTTEKDPTASVEFKIKVPSCVEDPRALLMDPYVNYYSDFVIPPSPSRDFFYPNPLNPNANYVWPDGSKRSILLSSVTPQSTPTQLQGVQKKKGFLGIVTYTIKPNTPLGKYQFEITGVAKKSNGAEQPTKGSIVTIEKITSESVLDKAPILIQDLNYAPGTTNKVPYLHVSYFNGNNNLVQLQSSSNLATWKTIAQSPIYSDYLVTNLTIPYTFIDKDAEKESKRFYRLYVAP